MKPALAQARLRDYLNDVSRSDISRVAGVKRNPQMVASLLASLARNEATSATQATLIADLTEQGAAQPSRTTLRAYLDELTRLFVIEPLPAFSAYLRSSARLRKTPKRYFADPALAVAALKASPSVVAQDLRFMGLLFESLVLRDLRVYAQSLAALISYYGDDTNLEADAMIECLDGKWVAVEIKLGGASRISSAMETLRAVRSRVGATQRGEPSRLIVIVAFGHGYQTDDGIAVVPLTALKP